MAVIMLGPSMAWPSSYGGGVPGDHRKKGDSCISNEIEIEACWHIKLGMAGDSRCWGSGDDVEFRSSK